MATNSFNYVDWLSMESLRQLLNKLQVAQFFNTSYNKEYTKEFAVGETVRINYPWRAQIRDGISYNPQSITRVNTTVTVDQMFGVDFEWDSAEAALKVERGREKIKAEYIEPAMSQLAQEIDSRCALYAMQNISNIVGVLGTDPTSFQTMNQARQKMVELAGWTGAKKGMIIPPSVNVSLVNAAVQYFNPTDAIAKQFKEGYVGFNSGFQWYESMSLYEHTAGTWAGTVEVASAPAQGATTLDLTVTNGDVLRKGDVFSIASVNAANPSTRRSIGSARTYVQTSDTQTVSGTAATISVWPPFYGPGSPYQNIDALPVAGADLTLFPGTASPNGKVGFNGLAINQDALALVGVKLEVPKACEMASQSRDPNSGISVRFVRMFDPQQSKMVNRFDVLLGFGRLYSDSCAVRVLCG
jgi:hypothetical protein